MKIRWSFGTIEFKILKYLADHQGLLVLREELQHFVWGEDTPSDRALDPHINALRKKLKKSEVDLRTIYGQGYIFVYKGLHA